MPPTIGLKLLHAGENPVFDIVAVHGLNGDAYRTWTWKATKKGEKDVLWLRDLLPNEIQDARIFTYGYDSMPAQVAGRASTKFIHQHAESFLQDLHAHRKGDEVYRPIIFIAHSLGGILVKQALINSSDCHVGHNEHLRSILNSTYGIMFMGTPHNGSGLANWGKFAESVISHVFPKFFVDTNPHLINTLGKNSEVLQNITQQFMSIQHQNPFQIFYFWEELKTKLPNGRMELVVEYSSAVLQGTANVQSYGIHGDHTSICRFENEESPGYDVLVRALIDWREAAPDAVGLKWAQYRDQVMLSNIHNNMSPTGSHIGTPPSKFLLLPPQPEVPNIERKMITPAPADDDISLISSTILSAKTGPHFIVSHHPNEVFEGREEDLARLDQILQNPKKREKGNASAVVFGISGSGKTHLVRQYVYDKRNNYPGGVFWVEAVSSASIKLGYWKLAVGLELTERTRFSEEPHGDFFVHLVTDWFQSHSKWLLVLDGADHETDFELNLLKEIIPGGADGAIIITTVNKALAGRARLGSPEGLSLKNMDTRDCVNILFQYARITEPSTEDIKHAEELVELMDFLPLAIHSAGSSMTVMQMDLGNYLRYYKKQPEVEGLTSFYIILDQLHKRYPEALNLIYILSFVERKVPVAMVEWGMKNWNGPPLVTKKHGFGLNVTLKHLLSYSLIERKSVAEVDDPGRVDTLFVHKVVQDICRLRMKQEGRGRLEMYFYHACKMFCRSFWRMEQRRRDKNFSVSDYRRFQVHIAKVLSHGHVMKLNPEDIGDVLGDLEEALTSIKNAINRYTPKYGSQSIDDGDGEYMPPKSQFSGSWSSLDESSGSASEAVSGEIVYHPGNPVMDSPLENFGPLFPPSLSGYDASSPTVRASGSGPASANRTPSPINHPFTLPSGSPPPAPPPLSREYISGLTPRNSNTPFSPPYPPSPGGPVKFPAHPGVSEELENLGMLNRNYSDPALAKKRSTAFFEQASKSYGDLSSGLGRGIHVSLPLSRDTSNNLPWGSPSRDPSRTKELIYSRFDTSPWSECGGFGMARVRSEDSKGSLKQRDRILEKLSSEAMSRSTSAGSVPGGVPLLSPTNSEPMSRRGSVGSVASVSRYHKLSNRPIPTIDSEPLPEIELTSEQRKGYHVRKGSGPGFHVEDEYDSGVDGVGGRVIEFGAPPPADGQGSRRGSVAGLGIGLLPATNPAEYLAASRRSSAPGAVQDPHHHGLVYYHHAPTPSSAGATGATNSPPSGSSRVVDPRSPSPASIVEAAGGAPMQRSVSEPFAGATAQSLEEKEAGRLSKAGGGVVRGRASLRRVSRAISPFGGKNGKRYSPREAFLEYEPSLDEEPLFEREEPDTDEGGKGKGKGRAE
ncbi:hypothetical protein L211DRAFT_847916 [Terfezia boudieri ATCC MYA-4762]|uniref:ORC1/DEAH AAA+ ATPase domain-containing protein n=1 Tax=Terfezia boudieri ATCC MYA-4762 TaxID=1051890 RepID=A0A3N4LRL9_9PEZI|nr:hypothetical protein L211DRAFT_847916 [Terfezia boudieri ATCC MYA-4762]